jgi:hypothetical protein
MRIEIPSYVRINPRLFQEFRLLNTDSQCKFPDPDIQPIEWERLNIDDRFERAKKRVHMK